MAVAIPGLPVEVAAAGVQAATMLKKFTAAPGGRELGSPWTAGQGEQEEGGRQLEH